MNILHKAKSALVLALIFAIAASHTVVAQTTAYNTNFQTSITYSNVGSGNTTVDHIFQNANSSQTHTVSVTNIPPYAGGSLHIGSLGGSGLPSSFRGSVKLASNNPLASTIVHIPSSDSVQVRPVTNATTSPSPSIHFASVLKNQFSTTSIFTVQNASSQNADITVNLYDAQGSSTPIPITVSSVPSGATIYFDMATLPALSGVSSFDGSAIAQGMVAGTSTPANIAGSIMELAVNGPAAKAFEAPTSGSTTVHMPTALCGAFNQNTAFGVTNVGTSTTGVTVSYYGGGSEFAWIQPGKKHSFLTCDVKPSGYSGAATITTTGGPIVAVGKKFKVSDNTFQTAFMGKPNGTRYQILPYVRWTSNANYDSGQHQRTFLAVTNVGSSTLSSNSVRVEYRNSNGIIVGTHWLGAMASGQKLTSTAADAGLTEFGNPLGNPTPVYGGTALIIGPGASQLMAVASVSNKHNNVEYQDDYNGIPYQP